MLLAKNRKALFNHEVIEKYLAGIELFGYEVKALREGKGNFEGSYVQFEKDELYVIGFSIGRYSKQSQEVDTIQQTRKRRLLLKRTELDKLQKELLQKGKTAIPLAVLLQHNMVKFEIGLVKGRKKEEKKILVKERQIRADMDREYKEVHRSKGA